MSCKKKIANLINQSKVQPIHPAFVETLLLDNDCKKYLKKNPDLSLLLKNAYQNSLMVIADEITAISRRLFAELEAITNYEDGDKKPNSHKQLIATHNTINKYILQDILQYSHIDGRTFALARWITIAQHFKIMADYNSYMATMSAIKMIAYYLKATVQGLSKSTYRYLLDESSNMMDISPSARVKISMEKNSTHLITPYFGDFRTIFLSLSEARQLMLNKLEAQYKRNEIDEIEYNVLKKNALDKYDKMIDEKAALIISLRDMHRFLFPIHKKAILVTDLELKSASWLGNEDIGKICRIIEDKMSEKQALDARSQIFQDDLISAFVSDNSNQIQEHHHANLAACLYEKSVMLRTVFNKLKTIFDYSTTEYQLINSYIAYRSDLIELENNYNTIEILNNDIKDHLTKTPIFKLNPLIYLTKNISNNLMGRDYDAEIKIKEIESYALVTARQAYKKSLNLKSTSEYVGDKANESLLAYQSAIGLAKAAKKELDIVREEYYWNEIKDFINYHHREYNNHLPLINQYKYKKETVTDKQNVGEKDTTPFPEIYTQGIFHSAIPKSHEHNKSSSPGLTR